LIAFNFEYYKPDILQDAVKLFHELDRQGKQPVYYSGGTEIITFARRNSLFTKAVIDIKGIPECNVFGVKDNKLFIGAAITLTRISEANPFPLLSKVARGIADHTARNKITVGGNICGRITFREAVLPFLLSDSYAVVAGVNGLKSVPINQIFNKTLQLNRGEFLVYLITDKSYVNMPYIAEKRVRQGKTGYPLITATAIKSEGYIKAAFSGICGFPFRSSMVEEWLNNKNLPLNSRIDNAIKNFPCSIVDNVQGSADYREFILRNMLQDILKI
jgi:CO/xanthine dehydrogenase FAD-binding subunit